MANGSSSGYTILETLIVIAVTSAMFLIVAITFGGRQQQVQFTQAVRNLDSKLNDIKSDVATGYYPVNENKRCRVIGGGPSRRPDYTNGSPPDLGTNEDCVSIGKVIQVSPAIGDPVNDNKQYINIYNVSGLRNNNVDGQNPLNLIDSRPTADPDPERLLLKWGLKITRVISSQSPATNDRGAIAFLSSLNRSSSSSSAATNEEVQINIIPGTNFNMNQASFVGEIDNLYSKISSGSVNFDSNPTITICVSDYQEERRARIMIGSNQSGNIINFDDVGVCIP